MPLDLRSIATRDTTTFPYIFEKNVDVVLSTYEKGVARVNVYRPHDSEWGRTYPVLVTYGPYGKDTFYGDFRKPSFDEVNPEHKSAHSAWETPDPAWWTAHGYAIVRADERGIGQSPGVLDTMSRGTSEAFYDVVEWAAQQRWSSGKVGLLGISYYAGTQWRVAARRPKGLAAIIPWEGMSDYYRDRCRHGGILSDGFIRTWWHSQVVVNQYGRPRSPHLPVADMIEGFLPEAELKANMRDQTVDTVSHKYRDEEYYATKDFRLEDIEVPLLSVANWGGILLHLRGNVEGYTHAGSKFKYLRFITGRHDLPFYYHEEALLQKSFLDAFLKGQDDRGWGTPGKVAPVSIILREGDVGFNNAQMEKQYIRREELAWPLPSTCYEKYYLLPDKSMTPAPTDASPGTDCVLSWSALEIAPIPQRIPGTRGPPPTPDFSKLSSSAMVTFKTAPFNDRVEFTGHVTAHLNVGIPVPKDDAEAPRDIDLFVTIRHLNDAGKEIFYTGTAGDPVPVTKGWLRVSLRKTDPSHPRHRPYLPYRSYFSNDVLPVVPGEVYAVDVEIWPTNVVVSKGHSLVFEIASSDTQGSGIFTHGHPHDRSIRDFRGLNEIHFGVGKENYVIMPTILS